MYCLCNIVIHRTVLYIRHFPAQRLRSDEQLFFVGRMVVDRVEIERHAVRTCTFDGSAIAANHLFGLLFSQTKRHLKKKFFFTKKLFGVLKVQ